MSLKAYNFFIMEKEKLNKYLIHVKEEYTRILIDHFNKHSELQKIIQSRPIDEWKEFIKLLPRITKAMQSQTFTDDEHLDLTSGVSIWIWNNYVVVKPYGLDFGIINEMKQPKYVKDFSYWDNVDKPEKVDNKEWNRRSKFFNKTIEKLPRIVYTPYDFLSREHFRSLNNFCMKAKHRLQNKQK